jgi:hypothetical protein
LGPWATANYCRAGIKSLRGTVGLIWKYESSEQLFHCLYVVPYADR